MHCKAPEPCKFKNVLGIKMHDVIHRSKQRVLEAIKDSFEGEIMQSQCSVLAYKIDLYFYEYKLVIEVDKLGRNDRMIDYKIQRQKTTENN